MVPTILEWSNNVIARLAFPVSVETEQLDASRRAWENARLWTPRRFLQVVLGGRRSWRRASNVAPAPHTHHYGFSKSSQIAHCGARIRLRWSPRGRPRVSAHLLPQLDSRHDALSTCYGTKVRFNSRQHFDYETKGQAPQPVDQFIGLRSVTPTLMIAERRRGTKCADSRGEATRTQKTSMASQVDAMSQRLR